MRFQVLAGRGFAPTRYWASGLRLARHHRVRALGNLLTGTSVTVFFSLFSVGFAARALGPYSYGELALILTLGQATERLLSFQAWQPLIRYGATIDPATDRDSLRSLYKFGLALDVGGCALSWFVASALLLAGHLVVGIAWATTVAGLVYMLSQLCNLNGMATAAFRLAGAYRTSARLQMFNALVRLVASAAAFYAGAGLFGFVAVWAGTQALGSLLNLGVALRLLQRQGITAIHRASLRQCAERFPNLWKFTWGSNASLTIWASAQQLDTLIVGALADPVSAGLFHIAKRISRVLQQAGSQLEAVVYPELSRMWAAGRRTQFVRLIVQTELVLALFGALCFAAALIGGRWAMALAAGPQFAAAAPLLTVQILAVSLLISGAASRAGLLAIGRQSAVLRTVSAAALTFYVAVTPLIWQFGAMGANVAHCMFGVVWLGGLALSLRRGLRQDLPEHAVPS